MLTLQMILQQLSRADFFDLANAPVNEGDYLLASVLPEQRRGTYQTTVGRLKVITTMAGETGMDSPYAPLGGLEVGVDQKPTAKYTGQTVLGEEDQRHLQEMVNQIRLGNIAGNDTDFVRNFLLNWLRKVVAQSFTDRNEVLRGEVLTTGQLVLRGGTIDFGVPSDNKKAYTGNDAFGGSASKFWQAIREGNRIIGGVRARLMSFDTLDMILDNDANKIAVVNETRSPNGLVRTVQIRKLVNNGAQFSSDVRDSTTLIAYNRKALLKNAAGGFIEQQVVPDGVIATIGQNDVDTIDQNGTIIRRPGLGYTHIGPTIEGEGRPGVYLNAYTPQGRAWQAVAEGAENVMTPLQAPEKLLITTTEMV